MALFGGDSTAFSNPVSETFGASGIGSPEQFALTIGDKTKLQNVAVNLTDNGAINSANELTRQVLDLAGQIGQSPATNFFNSALTYGLLFFGAWLLFGRRL